MKYIRSMLFVLVFLLQPMVALAEPTAVIPNKDVTKEFLVEPGERARGEFIIYNRGNSPLMILRVAPG